MQPITYSLMLYYVHLLYFAFLIRLLMRLFRRIIFIGLWLGRNDTAIKVIYSVEYTGYAG